MNNYNSFASKLAGDLQNNNMQKYMGTIDNGISHEREKAIQRIIDYEYNEFVRLIYLSVLSNRDKYLDGERVKKHYNESEYDLIPIFKKINEDCLNDPNFSKSLADGKFYYKKIGTQMDQIFFYVPGEANSIKHDLTMDLLYLPSMQEKEANRFRIDVKEKGMSLYPYLNFSIDFGDDGSINYNRPMIIDKTNNEDNTFTKTPTDMGASHVKLNENGIKVISDIFMDLFKKSEIIVKIDKNK